MKMKRNIYSLMTALHGCYYMSSLRYNSVDDTSRRPSVRPSYFIVDVSCACIASFDWYLFLHARPAEIIITFQSRSHCMHACMHACFMSHLYNNIYGASIARPLISLPLFFNSPETCSIFARAPTKLELLLGLIRREGVRACVHAYIRFVFVFITATDRSVALPA